MKLWWGEKINTQRKKWEKIFENWKNCSRWHFFLHMSLWVCIRSMIQSSLRSSYRIVPWPRVQSWNHINFDITLGRQGQVTVQTLFTLDILDMCPCKVLGMCCTALNIRTNRNRRNSKTYRRRPTLPKNSRREERGVKKRLGVRGEKKVGKFWSLSTFDFSYCYMIFVNLFVIVSRWFLLTSSWLFMLLTTFFILFKFFIC